MTENAPMLDLLWRSAFRWKFRPRQVTGDTAYGTTENIAAVERAGIRAYVPLTGAGKARPYFSKEEFAYGPKQDLYRCPAKEVLLPRTKNKARRLIVYKAKAGTCEACELKPKCTDNKTGRQVLRYFEEAYVDRVRTYRGTFPYEKALCKRRVWVEPLFAEAKDRHRIRRFRLRRLEKVNAEALLVATGQNVKRLLAFGHRRPRSMAQAAALRPPRGPSSYAAHATRRSFGRRGFSFERSATASPGLALIKLTLSRVRKAGYARVQQPLSGPVRLCTTSAPAATRAAPRAPRRPGGRSRADCHGSP